MNMHDLKLGDNVVLRNGAVAALVGITPSWRYGFTLQIKDGHEVRVNKDGCFITTGNESGFDVVGIAHVLDPQITGCLPTDSAIRKTIPLYSGLMNYFPDALAAVAQLSYYGNEKHNPGEPLHWSKNKSADHADCVARHLLDHGKWIKDEYPIPIRESAALAWRALALLQTEIENERKDDNG